jgi:hypothetical protein
MTKLDWVKAIGGALIVALLFWAGTVVLFLL